MKYRLMTAIAPVPALLLLLHSLAIPTGVGRYIIRDLGTLGGGYSSTAALNNAGQIVGDSFLPHSWDHDRAFLYQAGTMHDLGTLGGLESVASGINAHGQVVGGADISTGVQHPFFWDTGRMTDLGVLPGSVGSAARSINTTGQVVGWAFLAEHAVFHAFLWQDQKLTDLNDRLPLGSSWILNDAFAINDSGQVVGAGNHKGQYRAFLLNLGDNRIIDLGTLGVTVAKRTVLMPPDRSWAGPRQLTAANTRSYGRRAQ